MKKRGISPLIATVLLIGFTIVLSAMVMKWGGTLFKTQTEQTGTSIDVSTICVNDVNLELIDSCFVANKINLQLSNEASATITGLISLVSDINNELSNSDVDVTLSPFAVSKVKVNYSGLRDEVNQVKIYPKLTINNDQEVCGDQVFTLSNLESCIEPTSSMVLEFENNYEDSTGKNNPGTMNGNIGFVNGIIGSGVNFPNSPGVCSNYITYADSDELDLTDKFTIDFWFKLNGLPEGPYHSLLAKGLAYNIYFNPANPSILTQLNFGGADESFYTSNLQYYDQDDWNHLVLVFDSSRGEMKLYLNGNLEEEWTQSQGGTGLQGQQIRVTTYLLFLGRSPWGDTYCTNADIDELQILKEAIE